MEVQNINVFKEKWSGVALLIKIDADKLNKKLLNDSINQLIMKHSLLERLARDIR